MRVAVTGAMGAGKSSLVACWAQRGAHVVDADRIGHQVIERPAVKAALMAAFGADLEGRDGRLDRALLGRRSLADESAARRLGEIVHPPLLAEMWRQVDEAEVRDPAAVVVVDAPLLFECGLEDHFDAVVVVAASAGARLQRVAARLRLSAEEARQRLQRQWPAAEKARRADWVVVNDGDLSALEGQADRVWSELLETGAAGRRRRPHGS